MSAADTLRQCLAAVEPASSDISSVFNDLHQHLHSHEIKVGTGPAELTLRASVPVGVSRADNIVVDSADEEMVAFYSVHDTGLRRFAVGVSRGGMDNSCVRDFHSAPVNISELARDILRDAAVAHRGFLEGKFKHRKGAPVVTVAAVELIPPENARQVWKKVYKYLFGVEKVVGVSGVPVTLHARVNTTGPVITLEATVHGRSCTGVVYEPVGNHTAILHTDLGGTENILALTAHDFTRRLATSFVRSLTESLAGKRSFLRTQAAAEPSTAKQVLVSQSNCLILRVPAAFTGVRKFMETMFEATGLRSEYVDQFQSAAHTAQFSYLNSDTGSSYLASSIAKYLRAPVVGNVVDMRCVYAAGKGTKYVFDDRDYGVGAVTFTGGVAMDIGDVYVKFIQELLPYVSNGHKAYVRTGYKGTGGHAWSERSTLLCLDVIKTGQRILPKHVPAIEARIPDLRAELAGIARALVAEAEKYGIFIAKQAFQIQEQVHADRR